MRVGELMRMSVAVVSLAAISASCDNTTEPTSEDGTYTFDFASGPQSWEAGFADYPQGQQAFFELTSSFSPLPAPLGPGRSAWFLSGNNLSDDLFMYIARRVTGLTPRRQYRATFAVEIATDVPAGCGGVGGSPGESVFLKAGASTSEPTPTVDELGHVRLTIDKGNQAVGGANAVVLGTIENTIPCSAGRREWQLKSFSSAANVLTVSADATGAVWLIAGTDSGFEATTSIFFTRFSVAFERQ